MNDSFEKWRRRPVFVVQCFSVHIARRMGPSHQWPIRFRARWQYRDEASRRLRSDVARKIRSLRKAGLTAKDVRAAHEERLREPGYVTRVDLSSMVE